MSYGTVASSSTSGKIDLRSDTVTRPAPEMYEAMQRAIVGDDVLGDDPTVQELETLAATLMRKEAAVFVPSGTMGNQMAIATHCRPGDSLLAEEEAHVVYYEVGGPAIFAGAITLTVPSTRGVMDPSLVERRILKASIHTPGTTLLCLENTHNRAGGTVTSLATMADYRRLADRHGVRIHLDGARVFNAAVALGVPVGDIADNVDSINFCLSKGLRAPVGSILCGSSEFIDRARVWRKRLGGGMRQSGILAACGLVSLTKMVDRLQEDHNNAKDLSQKIQGIRGLSTRPSETETNIVLVETEALATAWQNKLAENGVLAFAVSDHRLRLVTHADFLKDQIDATVAAFSKISAEIHS